MKAEPYHALANSSWRFISIDGAPPVSDKAHLEFREDRLGANLGCNGMGGPWRVEDERLMAGPLTQTEMYCEGPVWDQEQAIVTLLSAAPQVMVQEGKLELRSSGHSARLEQVGPGPTPQRQGS
ncbi:hypothetical protein MB02_15605 [Croceicoccus estronivorus]|uniref:META domain-containing protein n=1 Tax=Croceicoccus estronivorus TaxID=1172626 RepID=UPI00083010D0|nr:hypothetical protein MB02_15605 [Croceicoccus estronivorus]